MDTSEQSSPPSAVKRLTELTVLFAFYLYFAGWVYYEKLFTLFGVSMHAVEIPPYFFIVYAYRVFFTSILGWSLLLAIAIGWYALASTNRRWSTILVLLLALAPFPLIRLLAAHRARIVASELRDGMAPTITVRLKPAAKESYPDDFVKTLEAGPVQLLTQTNERYYVFIQPSDSNNPRLLPRAQMYDIPLSDFVIEIKLVNMRRPQ